MSRSALKAWYFVLTSLGTLASSYYFNFLFFLLRDRYGFGDRENLWVAALHGAIYVGAAVYGGRFAERQGYQTSLLVGFGGVAVCLAASAAATSAAAVLAGVALFTVVLLFIWPALEALVVEGEPASRVPDRVGVYNCTWSVSIAVSYFTGGPLYDALGAWAIFGIPSLISAIAFAIVLWLREARDGGAALSASEPGVGRLRAEGASASLAEALAEARPRRALKEEARSPGSASPQTFLKLAWLANPLAYVAIYTLIAMMPGLATRLGLSATEAGVYGSLWFFGRFVAFVLLWQWTGWHYRFRWLVSGYVLMIGSFAACLSAPTVPVLAVAEIAFGFAVGLIYYSSLFYSMDVGEAQAEHGGWHEAMIGVGILSGPAVGAISLQFFPGQPAAGSVAVAGVLVAGLALVVAQWVWNRSHPIE